MPLSPEELREGLAPAFAVGAVGVGSFLLFLLGGAVNAGRVDRKNKRKSEKDAVLRSKSDLK